MMGSLLITLIADDKRGNDIILEIIASLLAVAGVDLPGECIGMNTAVHKEPEIVPVGRIDCLVLNGHIKAEEAAAGRVIVGVGQEGCVVGGRYPGRRRPEGRRLS